MNINFLLVFLLSLIISGNNSSLIIGPIRASGLMRGLESSIFVAFFITLGLTVEGNKMLASIPIITPIHILPIYILIPSLLILIIFSILSVPLSAGMVFTGAVMGYALYYKSLNDFVFIIFVSWIASFLISIFLGFFIYRRFFKRKKISNSKLNFILLIFSSAILSYSLGANTMGFLFAIDSEIISLIFIIIGIFAGTIFLNYFTYDTVKKSILRLTRERAIASQFSSFLVLETFTQLHLPVSITQSSIGSLVGTGISKGYSELNLKKVNQLILSWAITPLLSALIVMVMLMLLPGL